MLAGLNSLIDIIPPEPYSYDIDLTLERFQSSPLKFALQRIGELTDVSLSVLAQATERDLSGLISNADRKPIEVIDGEIEIGVVLARNINICQLVAHGSVDAGIIGLDQVYESDLVKDLVVVRNFREVGEWGIIFATPEERTYPSFDQILVVVTQYPVIAKIFSSSIEHESELMQTQGNTEVITFLQYKYRGSRIDDVVELRVYANALEANGMKSWNLPITAVFPVLIINIQSVSNPGKIAIWKDLLGDY